MHRVLSRRRNPDARSPIAPTAKAVGARLDTRARGVARPRYWSIIFRWTFTRESVLNLKFGP
jgi:hypothetical protein